MAMITLFDDLPDLALIELFCYLSCTDILWAFTCLNDHLTALIAERGFFRHVNLSSGRRRQFDTLLGRLPLNNIESLVIDSSASPLQLTKWPYLPRLAKLKLMGVRNFEHVWTIVLHHAATLTHLKIESNKRALTFGDSDKEVFYPTFTFFEFVKNVFLCHLPALRSLDLATDTSNFINEWRMETVLTPLTFLRVVLQYVEDMLRLMSTRPLSDTLHQLHVRIGDLPGNPDYHLFYIRRLPRMNHLRTFTFTKSFYWQYINEWTFIEAMTAPTVMPVLKRVNIAIVIAFDDLDRINRSPLFTDHRDVDVHYALIINDHRQHIEVNKRAPCGSRSHPKRIASATFVVSCGPTDRLCHTPNMYYRREPPTRQHLLYTLPWAFNEFFEPSMPDRCITQMEVLTPPSATTVTGSSRLLMLNASDNADLPITLLPHVIPQNSIDNLQLFYCDRHMCGNWHTLVRHVILMDSRDWLDSCSSFCASIRSIQIVIHPDYLTFTTPNWSALKALSALPLLSSLRVIIYDRRRPLDNSTCQTIAETVPKLADFGFCFRILYRVDWVQEESMWNEHRTFIEQLRRRILVLSLNQQPYVVVEPEGCGLIVWS